jgi:hypothetical protein
MASIFKEIIGGLEVAAGVLSEVMVPGNTQGIEMIVAGTATMIVGALPSRKPLTGSGSTEKNPIAPWKITYGRAGTGGQIKYGDLA